MKNIMIDLETLDTVATSAILSIGIVSFDLERGTIGDSFYTAVDIQDNIDWGRTISGDTLKWWMGQAGAAKQAVFNDDSAMTLAQMLTEVTAFIGNHKPAPWSNGADFDLPIMAHAFRQHALPVPWAYYHSRCYRTWKNLPGAKKAPTPTVTVQHNALADALYQAEHAISIYKTLYGASK
jgi:DNA polymerase III epsilon subunit-like protein